MILASILYSSLIASIMIFMVIEASWKFNLLDHPNSRKIHKKPTSRLGGVAIMIAALISFLLNPIKFSDNNQILSLLSGSIIVFLSGLYDDLFELSALKKLLTQIIATSIIVFYGGIYFTIGGKYNGILNSHGISIIITYLWIIGVTNAINLIDGMDGLAGGISFISFGAIITISILKGLTLPLVVSCLLSGAIIAFLHFNLPPASIFLGDSGSLVLGFNIAVLSLMVSYKRGALISIIFPSLFVLIPVADTVYAFFRRLLKGKNPLTTPDNRHIHHRLLLLKLSHNQALLLFYTLSALFSFIAITLNSNNIQNGIIAALMIILLIFILLYLLEKNRFEEKIKKFNNFTDNLKKTIFSKEKCRSKSTSFLFAALMSLYLFSLPDIYITLNIKREKDDELIILFFLLLAVYIIFNALIKTLIRKNTMIDFAEFWINTFIIIFFIKSGFKIIPMTIIGLTLPIFIYKLIIEREFVLIMPSPVDILTVFSILPFYIVQLSVDNTLKEAILLSCFFYLLKRMVKVREEKIKLFYKAQATIFTIILLILTLL